MNSNNELFSNSSYAITKLLNDLKIEESKLLELAQQFRQQLLKSNIRDKDKKQIDSDVNYIIDSISMAFKNKYSDLSDKQNDVGNILEKNLK